MLKEIEKAVRDQAAAGSERVRVELIKFKRFSGGFFQQREAIFEFNVAGEKSAILKSGKLSAPLARQMNEHFAGSNVFKVISLN